MCTYRLILTVVSSFFLSQNIASAQVVTDGTTGDATTLTGPDVEIGAELGTETGNNLYHSFLEFSIETGGSATFTGPGNIENIVGRVTGGKISSIDGLLASTIPGASLFLFNPAGVVFGPNASLDVTGSFHVSTADELVSEDGSRFSATNPDINGFTVAKPESFGFLGADPAGIAFAGSQLTVGQGETLSVVGGDIEIDGAALFVDQGEVNVLAADGAAEANLTTGELSGADGGDITVTGGGLVASIGDGGGTVRIEGGEFVVDQASSVFSRNDGAADGDVGVSIDTASTEITGGSLVVTSAQGDGRGGDLDINSESIEISGGSLVEVNSQADGRSGDANLEAETIQVADGSQIVSNTLASGDGGNLNIRGETVTFVNGASAQTLAQADGNGGAINIVSDDLTVTDNARIASSSSGSGNGGDIEFSGETVTFQNGGATLAVVNGSGDGGKISVAADDLTLNDGAIATLVNETGLGKGGDVLIVAGSIEVLAGDAGGQSAISTATFGASDAGDIDIRAGSLLADGNDRRSGASVSSLTDNSNGRGGQIRLDIDQIVLLGGGSIFADPSGGSAESASIDIVADTVFVDDAGGGNLTGITLTFQNGGSGDGESGGIVIRASDIELQNGAIIATTTTDASDAGDILIIAENLSLGGRGGSIRTQINTDSSLEASGDAGRLTIVADTIDLGGDSEISSSTIGSGNAGVIEITTKRSLTLQDEGEIETSSFITSTGNAGSIFINAGALSILDSGSIASSTFGSGNAGSISVNAQTALLDARNGDSFSGITTQGGPGSTGDAGEIVLVIDDLVIKNTSQITSSGFGSGNAGDISVTSETITIDDGQGSIDASTGIATSIQLQPGTEPDDRGDAGAIVIEADQLILRGDDAEIASTNDGAGAAGTIDLWLAEGLVLDNGADIVTLSESGGGGGITIRADDYVTVTGPNGVISSTVANDDGDAGDILIETSVLGLGDSSILAQADAGSGGDIQVSVNDLILSPTAEINAEAGATGVDGTVAVSSPETDVSGGLVAFDGRFLDVSSLLRERCAARRADESSSFTLGTGGALSADLDSPRLSLLQVQSEEGRSGQKTVLVLPCPKAAS